MSTCARRQICAPISRDNDTQKPKVRNLTFGFCMRIFLHRFCFFVAILPAGMII